MMENKEIDSQIAEKVMGWEFCERSFMRDVLLCGGVGEEMVTEEKWFKNGIAMYFVNRWNPSTNIAHAFEVVEKMKEKEFCFTLSDYLDSRFWDANFIIFKDSTKEFIGTANTPAMAICLAALEAVKAKEL